MFQRHNLVKESFPFTNQRKVLQIQINITTPINEVQYYDTVRELRWLEGRKCPLCGSKKVIKRGFNDKEPAKQRDNGRFIWLPG